MRQVCCYGQPDAEVYEAFCNPGLICNTTADNLGRGHNSDGLGTTVSLAAPQPVCVSCSAVANLGNDADAKSNIQAACKKGTQSTTDSLQDSTSCIRPSQRLTA